MKARPYIRSKRRISKRGEKPLYRIVKIDRKGRRRQFTVELTHRSTLRWVAEQFLKHET